MRRQAGSPSLLWDVSGYERRRLPPDLLIYSGYERRRLCPGDRFYPPVMNAGSLPNVVMCFSARYVPVPLSLSLSLSKLYVCYYGIITK